MMVILLPLILVTVDAVQFQIKNNAGGEIWVGILNNANNQLLENGGFKLAKGQQKNIEAPDTWNGRIWARSYCDGGTNHCLTGDCGNKVQCAGAGGNPPATLIEIKLKDNNGMDFYDVSLVDGFNLKASIAPQGGKGDNSKCSCKKSSCMGDINAICPGELQLKDGNGRVIGCKSACAKFNTDEYCCRGAHGTRETCKSSDWPKNYPKIFKDTCPDAFSYAYDDPDSICTCSNVSTYVMEFA